MVKRSVAAITDIYQNSILKDSRRNSFMIKRMEDLADRTIWAMGEQLKCGDFVPFVFEHKFNMEVGDGDRKQLMSGTSTLSSGSAQVKSGIKSLSDGAKELADGTKEFNDDGIKKLSDIVDDDLQDILDRLDAICSDDNAYRSFSGKEDDMDGNVKFVIETAAIDNDSDK